MATKKKTEKRSARSKKSEARKPLQPALKRLAKRKTVPDKTEGGKKAPAKTRNAKAANRTRRSKGQQPSELENSREVSGLQSGDLEGLSNVESADSESVDELLEEGNAFEAGVVSGVEDSRERAGKEVRTREVPEDDVPGEYLDQD
jgi:hypothetical protein